MSGVGGVLADRVYDGEDAMIFQAVFSRPLLETVVSPEERAAQLKAIFSAALGVIPGYILVDVKQCHGFKEAFCITIRTNHDHQVLRARVREAAGQLTPEKVGDIISEGAGLLRRLITVAIVQRESPPVKRPVSPLLRQSLLDAGVEPPPAKGPVAGPK